MNNDRYVIMYIIKPRQKRSRIHQIVPKTEKTMAMQESRFMTYYVRTKNY